MNFYQVNAKLGAFRRSPEEELNRIQFRTCVGLVEVAWNDEGKLSSIHLSAQHSSPRPVRMPRHTADLVEQLRAYFHEGFPLSTPAWEEIDRTDWSDFQKQVYLAITRIPHGETRTYGWVAGRVGKFGATRAVGQALRKNPLPVLIPCHRVVSVDSLGGFMGKAGTEDLELKIKKSLLGLEDRYRNPPFSFLVQKQESLRLESVS